MDYKKMWESLKEDVEEANEHAITRGIKIALEGVLWTMNEKEEQQ